jgi:hypothetical protein
MDQVHFLEKREPQRTDWLPWFVCLGGALALCGFLALLAQSYGLLDVTR